MMMNFKKVAGAGIAAVTFSLMAGTAMAGTFANATPTTYATQGIPASGLVTISATPVYTSTAATTTGSYLITYTLPTGVTFATSPSITTSGTGTSTAVLAGGGSGSNTATFTVNVTAVGTTILTLGSFQITGATALSTPQASGKFNMTEQVSGSTVTGIPNESTVSTAPLAISASQLSVSSAAPTGTLLVDIKSPSNGTKYSIAGTDGIYGDVGNTTVSIGTGLNSTATATYAFTSPSYVETFTGNTSGIATAYLSAGGTTSCATTSAAQGAISGSVAGVISGSTITFSGLPVSVTTARELCLYTAGTALLGTNPNGFGVTASIDTTTATAPSTATTLNYTYNGTALGVNYAVNTSSSYASYIRITNPTTSPLVVTALVVADNGSTGTATVEAGLAAGNNDLVSVSTITSAAGVTTTAGRYSITLFASGSTLTTGSYFESLLVSPGGVVSQVN